MPNVQEIMTAYLRANGFDGLCSAVEECACDLEGGLWPCGRGCFDCEAGYKAPCDCGDHDFHIVAEKPGVPPQAKDSQP